MDCRDAISLLRQRFDEGIDSAPEVEQHLMGCASCREKADELDSMNTLLYALPFEAPGGIEDRVLSALMQEHSRRNNPMVIFALAACTLASTLIINWLVPVQSIEQKLLSYLNSWIPNTEWLGTGRSYRDQFEQFWSNAVGFVGGMDWLSVSVMWSALATSVVLLVLLNGICAARLNHTGR
jgi:predicted anti-sigma-YlaC factor YlaD